MQPASQPPASRLALRSTCCCRRCFHRLFDHIKDIEAVVDPSCEDLNLLEHFMRKADRPQAVEQSLEVGRGGKASSVIPLVIACCILNSIWFRLPVAGQYVQ